MPMVAVVALAAPAAPAAPDADAECKAWWQSSRCQEKLERIYACESLVAKWASSAIAPCDATERTQQMKVLRTLFLQLLLRLPSQGEAVDHGESYTLWSRACAMLGFAVPALESRQDPLFADAVMVSVACLSLVRKLETSAAPYAGCADLLQVAKTIELSVGLPVQERTAADVAAAERRILTALDWNMPATDTYTVLTSLLLRLDVATQGRYKDLLSQRWDECVRLFLSMTLNGEQNGYATARKILWSASTPLHQEPSFLAALELACPAATAA